MTRICALAVAGLFVALPAAAEPWGPLDGSSPRADAAARAALARGRVDVLKARVDPLTGLQQATSGRSEPLANLASDLSSRFPGLGARVEGEQLRLNLQSDVLFDFDKADIRQDALPVLDAIAAGAGKLGKPIAVEGHTDAKGSDAYNQGLSERRAKAVEAALKARLGGAAGALTARGFGAQRPVAANVKADGSDDPAGRQRNRRVEIVIGG
ncbi:MAG: OmpA family protein [Pseudomonadota bacterium]|uniref:OmpA family protein n=1 Tax=Phenylobacterium sp. TaxID=1871053 RepID=UPI0025F41D55|nr:OmpA family protein [Phenylobacterium sp.]MBT9474104.1 OmpA family protein [Phenylobacterium sp.]